MGVKKVTITQILCRVLAGAPLTAAHAESKRLETAVHANGASCTYGETFAEANPYITEELRKDVVGRVC